MKHLILNSSLLAAMFFFWMVRKEIHRDLDIRAIDKSKKNSYYPD
ncbi:hypothetical protein [Candidatus Enterococcus moelleringii]|nr:hypothetical protein [Enterococcus sp. 669A]